MAVMSLEAACTGNEINSGKHAEELREHASRREATAPALKWALSLLGVSSSGETPGRWSPGWRGWGWGGRAAFPKWFPSALLVSILLE